MNPAPAPMASRRACALQPLHHLLLPPLVWCAAVAVGDSEHGRGAEQGLRRRCGGADLFVMAEVDGGHRLPAGATGVFEPHRRTLILSAPRVTHGVDVDAQRITETTLHVTGRQFDQAGRQLDAATYRLRAPPGVIGRAFRSVRIRCSAKFEKS